MSIEQSPLHPGQAQPVPGRTIAGPWPSYAGFSHLPERERWLLYASAKRNRYELETQGFEMAENYDAFVQRVTRELDI
ncbi:hypothetical protein [Phytopseudomonas dryadis]|uniref:Uncharacterized protein n=1 Tax=Phytopseudomonas dryadis TaxID=2487520 RepID=A0A4Q9QV87_9GAMM|nr:hypothetical protein [Pseudomonas dryadis]TBU86784.1 hypothetical protein DNK44_22025 [Pseudomonas dryadis]